MGEVLCVLIQKKTNKKQDDKIRRNYHQRPQNQRKPS